MTWIRAVHGPLAMATALAVAALIPNNWLAAATCTLIAIILIRPWRHRQWLGLTGGVRPFLLGVAVTLASATLLFTLGTLAGWLTWGAVDPAQLALFLITNTVIAVLLEAFPEELTIRGHTYSTLRDTHRPWLAAVGTTIFFLTVTLLTTTIHYALSRPLGIDAPPPSPAPTGEDPVTYLFLLTVFGFTLIAARNATGSIWTAVGTHLTFLTVNRLTLFGEARDAGWSMHLTTPDAALLIPAYLLLTAIIFKLSRRWRHHRSSPAETLHNVR